MSDPSSGDTIVVLSSSAGGINTIAAVDFVSFIWLLDLTGLVGACNEDREVSLGCIE